MFSLFFVYEPLLSTFFTSGVSDFEPVALLVWVFPEESSLRAALLSFMSLACLDFLFDLQQVTSCSA